MAWQQNLLETPAALSTLLAGTRRIAVLGIKTAAQSEQPAYFVADYLASAGFDVIPVPVYYPDVTEVLGRPVFRRVAEVPGPIDIVCVFRLPSALPAHLDDLLAAKPRAVWLQSGIRHDGIASTLAQAGIAVVQDRCLMVEHRLRGTPPAAVSTSAPG